MKCSELSAAVRSKCETQLTVRETPASPPVGCGAVRFAVVRFGVLRFANICCDTFTSGTCVTKVWKRYGLGNVTVR